jgi:polyisoprenyl-phosphate glycosyltransferase
MKKISICIPVYNEEKNILITTEKILSILNNQLYSYDYEIIFTDNNSKDNTQELIKNLCKENPKIKYVRFKKNLEYDKSVLEAYKHSTGDATIVIDCDLQDPPELIVEFVENWKKGYDLVYGLVRSRKENFIINFLRRCFYYIMNINSLFNYPKNAHDFRLIDKSIKDQLINIDSLFPYMRGLTFSLSKNSIGIEYDRKLREIGKSKLGLYNSFTYAANALIEETFILPSALRKISLFMVVSLIFFTIINVLKKFIFLSLVHNVYLALIILIICILTMILEYLVRIYFQIKKIRVNVYEKKINF